MFKHIGRRVDASMIQENTIEFPSQHVYDIYEATEDTKTRIFKDVKAGEHILVYSVGEKHLRHESERRHYIEEGMHIEDAAEEVRGNLYHLLERVNTLESIVLSYPNKEPTPIH